MIYSKYDPTNMKSIRKERKIYHFLEFLMIMVHLSVENKYLKQIIIFLQETNANDYLNMKHNTIFKFREVQCSTVDKCIANIKPKSSCGWDGMPVELMKSIKQAIIDPLTVTLINMLKTGIIPDKCNIAKVTQLYKRKLFFYSNYCPISLLSATSIVFKKKVLYNIMNT